MTPEGGARLLQEMRALYGGLAPAERHSVQVRHHSRVFRYSFELFTYVYRDSQKGQEFEVLDYCAE